MRFEHVRGLVYPFRVDAEERKLVGERLTVHKQFTELNERDAISQLSSLVETKSGVLLTHISMMIAVTGLMLAVAQQSLLFEFSLAVELVAYLLLALLCIRCQYQIDFSDFSKILFKGNDDERRAPHQWHREMLFGELFYREWLFRKAHRALYLLTFFLICTVLFGLFADEFNLLDGAAK